MTDRTVERPTCVSIKVSRMIDSDPDISWLDQSDEDMGEGYEATAAERKASYGIDWDLIGIQAEATFLIPVGDASSMQSLVSPGLWGIESDSSAEYLAEIEDEQITDVIAMLDALGIDHDGIEVER